MTHTPGTHTKHFPLAIETFCAVFTLSQNDVNTRYIQYSFLEGHCIYVKRSRFDVCVLCSLSQYGVYARYA